jgi:choline dehydrogenase-like flavoprotein
MGVPVHQVKEFSPRFSLGCSISSPPHLALALLHHPSALLRLHETWRHMAVYYAMIRGGRGAVRTLPFFRDPWVRYRLDAPNWADLTEAVQSLGRCLLAAGATALFPSMPGGRVISSANDLPRFLPSPLNARNTDLMTIHLFSSCPMGERRPRCAADSFGRVHGQKNLYIADASLLCTAPGVNPQGSIMAFARRNVLKFLKQL